MSVRGSGRRVAAIAVLAFSSVFAGCAADGERVAEPRTVRATSRDAPASLRYVESQRIVRVFTAEGMKPSVRDFDIAYELEGRDGQRTPLPFLDVRNADEIDVLNRVAWFADDQTWLGMSVRSTHHYDHLKGLQWEAVEDDFTSIRVVAFTSARVIARRDLRVCNPGREMNPAIRFDTRARTLSYCNHDGLATYDARSGQEHQVDRSACCPSATGAKAGLLRGEERLVIDEAS